LPSLANVLEDQFYPTKVFHLSLPKIDIRNFEKPLFRVQIIDGGFIEIEIEKDSRSIYSLI
jgi:hypothetical protein